MRAPGGQRRALFVGPVVALIKAGKTAAAPRDVIEGGLRHLEANTKLLQSGGGRSAKVMKGPAEDVAAPVETFLGFAPA